MDFHCDFATTLQRIIPQCLSLATLIEKLPYYLVLVLWPPTGAMWTGLDTLPASTTVLARTLCAFVATSKHLNLELLPTVARRLRTRAARLALLEQLNPPTEAVPLCSHITSLAMLPVLPVLGRQVAWLK